MAANLKIREESLTFRRKQNHELKKLFDKANKAHEKLIDVLEELMDSKDEKVRFNAASKLADLLITMAEHMNKDQITRLLLESKNPDRKPTLITDEDDEVPQVTFEITEP